MKDRENNETKKGKINCSVVGKLTLEFLDDMIANFEPILFRYLVSMIRRRGCHVSSK